MAWKWATVGFHLSWVLLLGACGSGPRPLLLLVSVDTLRADQLGVYGNPLGLTPHIDALMQGGTLFERAFATCSYTLPSIAALMTGRYPEELGISGNGSRLTSESATLAEILRTRGWRTGAVVSNYVLQEGSGIERGFDYFDDHLPQMESNREVPERIAAATTDAALRMFDRLNESAGGGAFLWIHYQDPHGPYLPPAGKRERFIELERQRPDGKRRIEAGSRRGLGSIPTYQVVGEEREVAFYRAGYKGEISYLDDEIGRLMQALDDRGVDEGAVIVFTSDHGEGLGENDYWFAHGEYLSDPLVRVPLSIHLPGRSGSRRSDPVSSIDLLPTLLAHLGLAPVARAPGRDLFAAGAQEAASQIYLASLGGGPFPRYGLVRDEYKYLITLHRGGMREELYQLGEEEHDLSSSEERRLLEMRGQLSRLRAGLKPPVAPQSQDLSPEKRERLRRLGYLVD
ncbi:MAG: sulfatase [Myxococcota bacterium]